MGCATSLVKYLLFLFNFIFVVGGIALVALGALTYTKFSEYDNLVAEVGLAGFRGPPIAMMIGGAIVFFIAFLGCCGAIKESQCMMSMYATILAIILILEIGAVITAGVYSKDIESTLKNGLRASMKNYGEEDKLGQEQTATWNNMQEGLKCCGTEKYTDWGNTPYGKIPPTCCINKDSVICLAAGIPVSPVVESQIYVDGCYTKVVKDIGIPTLLIIAGIIAGVELLGIVFGCCLSARFRNKDYRPR